MGNRIVQIQDHVLSGPSNPNGAVIVAPEGYQVVTGGYLVAEATLPRTKFVVTSNYPICKSINHPDVPAGQDGWVWWYDIEDSVDVAVRFFLVSEQADCCTPTTHIKTGSLDPYEIEYL